MNDLNRGKPEWSMIPVSLGGLSSSHQGATWFLRGCSNVEAGGIQCEPNRYSPSRPFLMTFPLLDW